MERIDRCNFVFFSGIGQKVLVKSAEQLEKSGCTAL